MSIPDGILSDFNLLIAPFNYFGIVSAFVLGWVVFGEFPLDTLFPGVLFIVTAGLVIIWRGKINKN